jgi:hypothetical protein
MESGAGDHSSASLFHMPLQASRPPRHQIKKARNSLSRCLFPPTLCSNTTFTNTATQYEYRITARIAYLAFTITHANIRTRPPMGSASPSATALVPTAQLTAVGSSFPYSTLKSGLNKTDASFASLVRQVGVSVPP